jgi:osmotically-inducible protein OsmY
VSASPSDIRQQIAERLLRQAEFDASQIRVQLRDSRVVLEGTVHSSAEVSDAEDVAWTIPGIVEVENRLQVAA